MTVAAYRADIDGLRAVAVLLVVMFHLGLGVPGGYIGVDVFFVISGFLITGILKREIEQDEFTFSGFYARRARRIMPALLAVMLLSSMAALFILLPTDLERYAKSMAATLLSVSNFWFWSQGGYFGAASELAPMLHTWSLAVEEQFYILLPIALLFLYRRTPRLVGWILSVGCIGTFAASAWFVSTRTPEVFYFSPFRAWELLLGSLLAFYRMPVVAKNLYRQLITVAALLLIAAPAFTYSALTVFPGPTAALPCIGAALLIWIGSSGDSVIGSLLKSRAMVFIGLISYSLYLWHWPLLVLAKHFVGESIELEMRLGIAFVAFLLAILSWRFVETPFRSKTQTSDKQAWIYAGLSMALLSGMAAAVLLSHGWQGRFSPRVVALDRASVREVVRTECIDLRVPLDTNTACHIGAHGNATVLVWGDSYAHAMLPAFDTAFKRLGIAAWFVAESGCPPMPAARVSYKGRYNWRCRDSNDKVVNFIGAQLGLRQVVLAAAWDSYGNESSGYKVSVGSEMNNAMSLKQGIETLSLQLQSTRALSLIVVGQVPTFDWSVPQKMLRAEIKSETVQPMTRTAWLEKSSTSREVFQQLINSKAISFVDSAEWFCTTGNCQYANAEGQPLYWDQGHINAEGARFVMPMLEGSIHSLIGDAKDLGNK